MRDCVDEYEGTPPAEFEFNEPCEVEDDGLPPSENLADAIRRNPPLKSELIDGVFPLHSATQRICRPRLVVVISIHPKSHNFSVTKRGYIYVC